MSGSDIYAIIGVCLAPIAGIIMARQLWYDFETTDDLVDKVGIAFVVPVTMVFTIALWGPALGLGVITGIGWLVLQAAKPGRIQLRLPKRRRLEDRITELEAELGIRR